MEFYTQLNEVSNSWHIALRVTNEQRQIGAPDQTKAWILVYISTPPRRAVCGEKAQNDTIHMQHVGAELYIKQSIWTYNAYGRPRANGKGIHDVD